MAIYIVKMKVWNGSQTMWYLFKTSAFNTKNLPFFFFFFLMFLKPYLYVHARACLRRPKVFFGLYFPKIDFFAH